MSNVLVIVTATFMFSFFQLCTSVPKTLQADKLSGTVEKTMSCLLGHSWVCSFALCITYDCWHLLCQNDLQEEIKQEAQLSQRDCTTCYGSKLVLMRSMG